MPEVYRLSGLWLQKLTTNEPNRDQIEVALASLKALLGTEETLTAEEGEKHVEKKLDSIEKIHGVGRKDQFAGDHSSEGSMAEVSKGTFRPDGDRKHLP